MCKIKVSYDAKSNYSKPSGDAVKGISKRIAESPVLLSEDKIREFALNISLDGHTFCPATFKNGSASKENFEQQQFLALDFDNKNPDKSISFEEVRQRADQYELPVLFAYDTMSSVNHDKFRVVFANDNPITEIKAAEMMLKGLVTIFPEADPNSTKPTQIYFGGNKEMLYFNNDIPMINTEALMRNTINYLEDKYGPKHYKPHADRFYRSIGISMNDKNQPDISVVDCAEAGGANEIGDFLQNPIIEYIPFGKKSPKYLRVNFTSQCTKEFSEKNKKSLHRAYQPSVFDSMSSACQLFREFAFGTKILSHNEIFGIATNVIQIQTGEKRFREILHTHRYYDDEPQKYHKWDQDLRRIRGYRPYSCDGFCPYCDSCPHSSNILSTVKPKYHQVEKIVNVNDDLATLDEARENFKDKFFSAVQSGKEGWHIIKCQTALGKTQTILEFLKSTELKVLVAVPTNKLKREVCERAVEMGITVAVSPSMHELKDEIPEDIWDDIEVIYNSGKPLGPYLNKTIEKSDKKTGKVLRRYMTELDSFVKSDGHAITTHRRLTNMNVSKYDLIIIDEDIIYSTIIPSRETVSISDLKHIKKRLPDCDPLVVKIKRILSSIKDEEYFTLHNIKYDATMYDDLNAEINIPALCSATYFCCHNISDSEYDKNEKVISFMSPAKLPKNKKVIMLSATADKKICEYYFDEENIEFHECKQAMLTGVLNQYCDKPMSRSYMTENKEIIDKIKQWSGFEHTITFMKFDKYCTDDLHFGNCAGCDTLKNTNIDVIGTPHQPEWIYKLFAYSLGFDVDSEIKPNTVVTHNGYRFYFTTYEEEILRNIQFYMIESELEQAVGRARLLRYGSTVNLFSNFPLRQANIKKSEYE